MAWWGRGEMSQNSPCSRKRHAGVPFIIITATCLHSYVNFHSSQHAFPWTVSFYLLWSLVRRQSTDLFWLVVSVCRWLAPRQKQHGGRAWVDRKCWNLGSQEAESKAKSEEGKHFLTNHQPSGPTSSYQILPPHSMLSCELTHDLIHRRAQCPIIVVPVWSTVIPFSV